MLAATKVKMSGSQENEQEHVGCFLHKTRNQEVSRCSRTKMYKVVFLPVRPILVVLPLHHRSRFVRRLALHDYIFCLADYTEILSRASVLSLAKSIYYYYSLLSRIL